MKFMNTLLRGLSAASLAGLALSSPVELARADQRPIYAIAHRVLRNTAVSAALSHGANASEVDLRAWTKEWWADHDGGADTAGATAREIFTFIADQRKQGSDVSFVWLDIKNPDDCDAGQGCSIEALRDLVRETLEPAGVRALYGFFGTEDSRGFKVMQDSLNGNEAVVLSGEADEVQALYGETKIGASQRVMDYGDVHLDNGFGDCTEESWNTCTELKQGAESRDQGKLGKVLGWTSTDSDTERVGKLLGTANVDGIIFGYQNADYADDEVPKAAGKDIIDFVKKNSDSMRMAKGTDAPW